MLDRLVDSIIQHNGIDWIAMSMNFFCYHHLASKRRSGFVFGMLASVAWLVFNLHVESFAGVLANAIFVWLNLRGWQKWVPDSSDAQAKITPKNKGKTEN